MAQTYTIELKRGLFANLPSSGNLGEPYFCTDTGQLFIWNGTAMVQISVNIPVTSVFGRTGVIAAANGDYSFSEISGLLGISQISATGTPSINTYLRGDGSWATVNAGVTSVFGRTGAVTAQTNDYSFSEISGTVAANQLPNPSATTLGGVESSAPVTHQFVTGIGTDGSVSKAQPAAGDVSGLATSATTDTTNAANISSGTLPAARLPNPTPTTLGGVESKAASAHQFVTQIGTDGSVSTAQPSASDVSGLAASATTDTTNASNITSGTLSATRLPSATNSALGAVELNTDLGGTASAPQVVSTHLASPLPVNQGGTGTTTPALVAGTGVTVTGSFPNQTVNAVLNQVIQSGLIGEYRILSSETAAALVDYSGNGNNATGTVGTSPGIISGSGGIQCNANGAVSLPSALNSALTIMIVAGFQPSAVPVASGTQTVTQSMVQGNNGSHYIDLALLSSMIQLTANSGLNGFTPAVGCYRPSSIVNGGYQAWSQAAFTGVGSIALTMGGTDAIYVNSAAVPMTWAGNSAGAQTAGNFQLGGLSGSYFQGQIYYALFYNRALSASEVAANHNVMVNALAARGVNLSNANVNTDTTPQVVLVGDSITAGVNGVWSQYIGLPLTGLTTMPAAENQGVGGTTGAIQNPYGTQIADSLYRPGALANALTYWLGTNDNTQAVNDWGLSRNYLLQRKAAGFKTIPITMLSRTGEDTYKDALNPVIRSTWNQYSDALCDIAANPNLGADGAYNGTYFGSDHIHPTALANQVIIAPLVNAAMGRIYGNRDFSNAATYSAPSGTITFNQAGTISVSGANYVTYTFGNQQPGTLFVFEFVKQNAPTWVSDSLGNTYYNIANTSNGGSVWCVINNKPGTMYVRAYWSGGVNFGTAQLVYAQYVGVAQNQTIEASGSNNTGSGTTMTGTSVTPAENGALVIGVGATYYSAASVAASGSYTLRYSNPASWLEDWIQTTATTTTPTATNSNSLTAYGMVSLVFSPQQAGLVVLQDTDVCANANPASASVTMMLPTAVGMTGQTVSIKNVQSTGANTVTVVPKAWRIRGVTGNGTTVTYTVDNTYSLVAGQTVAVSGCTTGGFNGTFTVATVPSTTTFTVTNSTNATENEPVAAQYTNEFIDGGNSTTVANTAVAVFQSVLVSNTAGGANWIRIQ